MENMLIKNVSSYTSHIFLYFKGVVDFIGYFQLLCMCELLIKKSGKCKGKR